MTQRFHVSSNLQAHVEILRDQQNYDCKAWSPRPAYIVFRAVAVNHEPLEEESVNCLGNVNSRERQANIHMSKFVLNNHLFICNVCSAVWRCQCMTLIGYPLHHGRNVCFQDFHGKKEIFTSKHTDFVNAETVIGKCSVMSIDDYQVESRGVAGSPKLVPSCL